MRTTINLDDDLVRQAKAEAVKRGRTLTSIIEDALRAELTRKRVATTSERFRVDPLVGRGLQPGVDLDDSAAMLDLMEKE